MLTMFIETMYKGLPICLKFMRHEFLSFFFIHQYQSTKSKKPIIKCKCSLFVITNAF